MCKIDPKRLARAFDLKVQRLGRDLYRVTGGEEAHLVRYAARKCDCKDHMGKGTVGCKHMLAVMLTRLAPARIVRAAIWCGVVK